MKKRKDLYLWMARTPNGPSAKFLVLNVHTMLELKMTGNSLLGSRPILSFDPEFDSRPDLELLKELFKQMFSVPEGHPRSKPFIDRVIHFALLDGKIWFRNYQILPHDPTILSGKRTPVLVEIGPRLVLDPIRILEGSFVGTTIYENPSFISPNELRSGQRIALASKYKQRKHREEHRMAYQGTQGIGATIPHAIDDVFNGN